MIISSLIVETLPRKTEEVSWHLEAIEGVEVHEIQDNQIIVTIENETVEGSHETASSFIAINGVANINLIYANFEDDPHIKKMTSQ